MEKNKNKPISGGNKRRNEDDKFVSEYVSIPASEGLKITIRQSDVPQALKQNIMEYESRSDSSEQGIRTPLLHQKVVVPVEHHPSHQPTKMTLPSGRTQPLPNKPTAYKPKPKLASNPTEEITPHRTAPSPYRWQRKPVLIQAT